VHGTAFEGYCQVDTVAARHARSHLLLGAKRVELEVMVMFARTVSTQLRRGPFAIQRDGSTSPVRVCGSAAIDCRIVSLSIHPDHEAYSDPKADTLLSFKRQAMYWLLFVRVTPARCHVLCSLSYAQTKAAQDRKQQSACMTRSTMRGLWRYKANRARARETLGGDTRLVKPGTGPTLFGNGCRDLGEAPRGCQDARANQLFWPMVRLVWN
jgi:hypothetical protein